MAAPNTLSEVHRKMITAYLNGMSKAASGEEVGLARSSCYDAFALKSVKTEISRRQKQMSSKAGVDADWIVAKLKAIANADLADLLVLDEEGIGRIDLNKLRGDLRTALTSYSVRRDGKISVNMSDKLKALDMLARHLGMYQDKVILEGEMTLVERLQAGRDRANATKET